MNKILVVEDDLELVKTLSTTLARFSRRVFIAKNYSELEKIVDKHFFELAIFDRMLLGKDSLPILSYLRDISPQTKILVLSSKAEIGERIKGLESGADDYLSKPFSLKEFILRVRILLNSERISPSRLVKIGSINFDLDNNELNFSNGKTVNLRQREADVLRCLARYKGRMVSRDQIINEVWPHLSQPNNDTIDVYIKRLRNALGKHKNIIKNKRGMGYKLEAI